MKKILILLLLTFPNLAMAGETAQYQVLEKISDNIEIREYNNLMLAKITTAADEEGNQNFRALFNFISGDNKKEQEISMTTPVFRENINNQRTMSFVMPAKFNADNAPIPNNKNIKVEIVENVKFIAITFSGRWSESNFNEQQEILTKIVKEKNIDADIANPVRAYYNSPWTLPFFKKNEVLFRVK